MDVNSDGRWRVKLASPEALEAQLNQIDDSGGIILDVVTARENLVAIIYLHPQKALLSDEQATQILEALDPLKDQNRQ